MFGKQMTFVVFSICCNKYFIAYAWGSLFRDFSKCSFMVILFLALA